MEQAVAFAFADLDQDADHCDIEGWRLVVETMLNVGAGHECQQDQQARRMEVLSGLAFGTAKNPCVCVCVCWLVLAPRVKKSRSAAPRPCCMSDCNSSSGPSA